MRVLVCGERRNNGRSIYIAFTMTDLHNDYPTALPPEKLDEYVRRNYGIDITAVIWTSELGNDAENTVSSLTDRVCNIRGVNHVAIEDLGFLSERAAHTFPFEKYAYCSLGWNYNNAYIGGALDDGTLTEAGKRLIERMNGRCAVDLAHTNERSFYAVMEVAERVLCSHTGFNGHLRSIDDGRIRAVIDRRGIVGLCAVTAFTDAHTAGELAAVIDKFVSKYGIDNLALGTDFNGSTDLPNDFNSYECLPVLESELSRFGYSGAEIDKIFTTNAKRFYEEIENERHL